MKSTDPKLASCKGNRANDCCRLDHRSGNVIIVVLVVIVIVVAFLVSRCGYNPL